MDPLADIAELEMRLGRNLTGAEALQAFAALHDASATVRSYTGQRFTRMADVVRLRVVRGRVRLPVAPVEFVTAVTSATGAPVAYEWDGGQTLHLQLHALNGWEIEPYVTPLRYVEVDYVAGMAPTPDDVVAVVCQVAGRALTTPPDSSGVTQESLGSWAQSVSPTLSLMTGERQVLDRYRNDVGVVFGA